PFPAPRAAKAESSETTTITWRAAAQRTNFIMAQINGAIHPRKLKARPRKLATENLTPSRQAAKNSELDPSLGIRHSSLSPVALASSHLCVIHPRKSRRNFALQPKVAAPRLPWVPGPQSSTSKRLRQHANG